MTIASDTPDNPKSADLAAQELLQMRDLQNAQVVSMMHVWDNPEDEVWNDPNIPGVVINASGQGRAPPAGLPVDEYGHLSDLQWDLYDRMSAISEDCFCAGWIGGNEYDIWNALQHGDHSPAHRRMAPRLLRLCRKLTTEINGWIYWADGPRFAPMPQWLAMVEERRKRGETDSIST